MELIDEVLENYKQHLKDHHYIEMTYDDDCVYAIHRMKNDSNNQERWRVSKEVAFGKEYNDYEVTFMGKQVLCECAGATMGKICRHQKMVELVRSL